MDAQKQMEPLTSSVSNDPAPDTFMRNANIDAIRGFAVLGILFMNIYTFGNAFYGYAEHEIIPALDTLTELFSNFFLEGRFMSLFSMLFGVGLAIQFERLSAQGHNANKLMKSRLNWLLIFGALHAIFIWSGDILFTYALSGFIALRYLNNEPNQQMKKALLFISISLLLMMLIGITDPQEKFIRTSEVFTEEYLIWSGAYVEQLQVQLSYFGFMLMFIPLTLMWLTAGLMLLGVALYRKNLFTQGFTYRQLTILIASGILLSFMDSLLTISSNPVLNTLSYTVVMLSAISVALVYIHLLVKVCQNRTIVLAPLQKVGRLAFSLYILQSVCGVLLFRHFAPTLMSTLDRPGYMLIAFGFSIFQVILASVYLKYFNQGPLEWLWRRLATRKLTATATQTTPIASADT